MALSGTIYSGNFGSNSFRLKLTWSATQNVSANTSTITTKLYFESLQSWAKFSDGTSSAVNINIDGSNSSGSANSSISGNQSKHIYTHTRTVGHASDGTKSLTISAGHTIDISYSGSTIGSRSLSGAITLNPIARASTPTLSTGTVALGETVRIDTNRMNGSFTHTVTYDLGGMVKTIATKSSSWSVNFTTTSDLATKLPNSTSGWGNIWVETFNGNTSLGRKSVKLTVTVPDNGTFNPSISTPTLTEANTAVTSAVGSYWVQRNSKVRVSASPTTRLGATVSRVEIKVKSSIYSGTTITTGALGDAGAHTVTATVTDSRGRKASSSTSFTVMPYTAPRITSFKASRSLVTKTNIEAQGTASISDIGTVNTTTLKVSTSPKGKNTWTLRKTVMATSGTSITSDVVVSEGMPITDAFDVKLEIYDELNPKPSIQIISVGTAVFPMSWGKTGIGVGTVFDPTGSALQVVGGASIDEYISQRIPAGENLNNYTKTGFYFTPATADAQMIANAPRGEAFSMLVEKHAGAKQTVTTYTTDSIRTYTRNYYSGTWGKWNLIYDNSGWVQLPLRNVTRGDIKYKFMEGKVNICGYIDKSGEQRSGIAIANMPTWASPNTDIRFTGASYEIHTSYPEQHACTFLLKGTDGELSIQRKSAIERFFINETYMVKD